MTCWIHENSRVDGGSHFVSKEDIQEAHGGRFSGISLRKEFMHSFAMHCRSKFKHSIWLI